MKAPIFMEVVLAIEKDHQSNLEEKVSTSILKDDFSLKTDLSIFTSIAPVLLDQPNETIQVFPAWKSTSHFLPLSTVSHISASSLEANSSCCHRSEDLREDQHAKPCQKPCIYELLQLQ